MKSEMIKPCPFCGETDISFEMSGDYTAHMECSSCLGASGYSIVEEDGEDRVLELCLKSLKKWNNRHAEFSK